MNNHLALKGGAPLRTKPFSRWPVFDESESSLLLEVLNSGKWSFDGPKEQEFAKRFAAFTGAKEALCVANGSVSLEIALRALGVGPGDEVIVPALTWIATAWAVVQVGATPVFADVSEADWCIGPKSIRERITPRTRAIIPVHLYDQMADMDQILEIAREHSLEVIEDCAHAHGAQWEGRSAGTLGAIGSYSFQQSKVMTSGEGGVLLTNRPDLAEKIYSLKNCGRKMRSESPYWVGTNHRMTEFQCAVLLAQLGRLEAQMAVKTSNAEAFRGYLSSVPGMSASARKTKITRAGMYGISLRYDPAKFGGAPVDLIISALVAEGIPVQRTYDLVYQSPLWASGPRAWKFGPGVSTEQRLGMNASCPVAERITREGIVILHHVFLGPRTDVADLAAGFEKVQEHASELRMDIFQKKARSAARTILRKVGVGV